MSVYAQNLLRELTQASHDVTMISQYRGDEFGRAVYGGGPPPDVPGVRVIGLEQSGEQSSGDFERDIDVLVKTICAEHALAPFDVLHAQYGYPTGWAVMLAAKRLQLPSVVSIQGGDGHWIGSCCETHREAMVRVLDHASAVLIGCRSFAEEVSGRLGTQLDRFTIVPGAVETNRFTPAIRDTAASPVLLYHGRVDARKGALDLLEAVSMLAKEHQTFSVVYSGIGPDYERVAVRVAELGLTDRVRMAGYVDYADVPEVYREADIFVSPTYAEGFSNTILEAMASGLACVSCNAVGVVDCLRNEENGLLSDPGDIPALADNLRRVLTDPALRTRLARAGLDECRRVYSWHSVGRQIMHSYVEVLQRPINTGFSRDLPVSGCHFRSQPHLL